MSADNQLAIIRRNNKFLAYDVSASCEIDYNRLYKEDDPQFSVDTLEDAIREAQKYCEENICEYGYYFVNF